MVISILKGTKGLYFTLTALLPTKDLMEKALKPFSYCLNIFSIFSNLLEDEILSSLERTIYIFEKTLIFLHTRSAVHEAARLMRQ